MMSPDTTQPPTLDQLIATLIEKTEQGKLHWDSTAQEDTFFCAVKGEQTFTVSSNEQGSAQVLSVRDRDGQLVIKHTSSGNPAMRDLHEIARMDALGITVGVDRSLRLLNSL